MFLEAAGPRNSEQDVHEDRLPLSAREEGPGQLVAEVLLSVHKRK